MWTADGVAITTVTSALNPRIIADESGGATMTWEQYNGSHFDIYAQQIDSSGAVHWGLVGKQYQLLPSVSDIQCLKLMAAAEPLSSGRTIATVLVRILMLKRLTPAVQLNGRQMALL